MARNFSSALWTIRKLLIGWTGWRWWVFWKTLELTGEIEDWSVSYTWNKRQLSELWMRNRNHVQLVEVFDKAVHCLLCYFQSLQRGWWQGLDNINEGVNVGGEIVTDVRFADDRGMVSETEKGLQKIMDSLNEISQKYGMKINVKKTKVMVISRKGGGVVKITLNGERIEQLQNFVIWEHG